MVPLYLKYMGAEAYGLVGFYAMLQAWFQMLDMGLTPTMSRETARFNGDAGDALRLRRLLRVLEGIFIGLAFLGCAAIFFSSGYIANSWLKVKDLPLDEVHHAIILMGGIVALRWVCGLYRGTINGFERMVWLSSFNICVATCRFVLVIPFFIYVGASPSDYFSYQLLLAVIEFLVLVRKTYKLLPKVVITKRLPWDWAPLRSVLKFSLSIAFTSSVWVLVTQTDKLLLSKFLSLADYAYFTLAVLVASGIMVISSPISAALLPRLTKLNTARDEAGLILLYRHATQFVCGIAIPVALVLAFFSEQVLWAWTGNSDIATKAAPVLTLYALGNGILAIGAFPYYLQFAKGDLKLHMIGNILFIIMLIPGLIWATMHYGVIGAGYAWLSANSAYFLFWVPLVHRRFVKGLHSKWLFQDIIRTVGLPIILAVLVRKFAIWPHERIYVIFGLIMVGLIVLSLSVLSSAWLRKSIFGRLNNSRKIREG